MADTAPRCAKLCAPCPDGCPAIQLTGCGGGTAGDCWRVKPPLDYADPWAKAKAMYGRAPTEGERVPWADLTQPVKNYWRNLAGG